MPKKRRPAAAARLLACAAAEPARAPPDAPPAVVQLRGPPLLPPGAAWTAPCPVVVRAAAAVRSAVVQQRSRGGDEPLVVVAEGVLSAAECRAWIEWGEKEGFAREAHPATKFVAHRDNGRLAVSSPDIARVALDRLRPLAPAEVDGRPLAACNPNLRLYKYEPGQRFGRHVDQANLLPDGTRTEFTVLFYLSGDGLEGGETAFYQAHDSPAALFAYRPRQGAALLHAHGDRCLTHEGAPVTRGAKYVLRTDLAYATLPGRRPPDSRGR